MASFYAAKFDSCFPGLFPPFSISELCMHTLTVWVQPENVIPL